jgi:hypothetical protein
MLEEEVAGCHKQIERCQEEAAGSSLRSHTTTAALLQRVTALEVTNRRLMDENTRWGTSSRDALSPGSSKIQTLPREKSLVKDAAISPVSCLKQPPGVPFEVCMRALSLYCVA